MSAPKALCRQGIGNRRGAWERSHLLVAPLHPDLSFPASSWHPKVSNRGANRLVAQLRHDENVPAQSFPRVVQLNSSM
ncbi:protein of unknown function [Candidatus Filomicrobium marinum]|uniref:Uncharacterized protein n=1 Tax=Candidatus Filomicrobium marinum TaxID=1608628 RepID=A0A0D6JFH6_9HYPH|nr:protein of unknown function [Candidatus Filomicrobium marinum]